MYLVDFPQQRHTHTQTPRNINKFATVEAKDSGPERQMESEREREKKREGGRDACRPRTVTR